MGRRIFNLYYLIALIGAVVRGRGREVLSAIEVPDEPEMLTLADRDKMRRIVMVNPETIELQAVANAPPVVTSAEQPVKSLPAPAPLPRPAIQTRTSNLSSMQGIYAELNSMVGMHEVKRQLEQLYDYVWAYKATVAAGGVIRDVPSFHMALMGNPGTGKTTVARLCGQIFYQAGIMPTAKFTELDRSTIVQRYIGATEEHFLSKIKEAYGGVLFIDEAHQLYQGDDNPRDFGRNAIGVLIRQMEEHRHELVVILAGYPGPMEKLIAKGDEGMRRRIGYVIRFPDYTNDELAEVFVQMAGKNGLRMHPKAHAALKALIDRRYTVRPQGFGNAGEMRNVLRDVNMRRGRRIRLGNIQKDNMLMPEDFQL